MITISRYTPADAREWDEFLPLTRNATFLHHRPYMDYHSDRFSDCSLMARSDSSHLLAVLPANRVGTELWSHQGLTYGGWLMSLKHTAPAVMLHVMQAACEWMRAEGLTRLIYKPVPHIYHSYPADDDLYALWRQGATLRECNISTAISLANPLPFDRGNKSGVNAALKHGVRVGQSDDWTGYWDVLGQVLQERHNAWPVHSLSEIELLHSHFPEQIRLYTATLDGQMVAGVVMFLTRTVAHAQYIASSPVGREVKALPLLFHELIAQAKQAGYAYFDFGTSNEQHGLVLNEGLVEQKSRLGGRGVAYCCYQLDL